MDKLRRLLDQGDAVYKYDSGWHRNSGGCQGERKAGASKSNQGASHRNKNRLASRRRRGMRIREGETRQNTRRKEGRPGFFCSGWMDGDVPTFVHAAEWVDGATNRHQPQARLYAAKIRQLRIFFSSSPRTNVQGGPTALRTSKGREMESE